MPRRRPPRGFHERIVSHLESRGGGTLGGRVSSASPVVSSDVPASIGGNAGVTDLASGDTPGWDRFTLGSSGAQTVDLENLPIENSVHVYLNREVLDETVDYTIGGATISILSAAGAVTTDILNVRYLYRFGAPVEVPDEPADDALFVAYATREGAGPYTYRTRVAQLDTGTGSVLATSAAYASSAIGDWANKAGVRGSDGRFYLPLQDGWLILEADFTTWTRVTASFGYSGNIAQVAPVASGLLVLAMDTNTTGEAWIADADAGTGTLLDSWAWEFAAGSDNDGMGTPVGVALDADGITVYYCDESAKLRSIDSSDGTRNSFMVPNNYPNGSDQLDSLNAPAIRDDGSVVIYDLTQNVADDVTIYSYSGAYTEVPAAPLANPGITGTGGHVLEPYYFYAEGQANLGTVFRYDLDADTLDDPFATIIAAGSEGLHYLHVVGR